MEPKIDIRLSKRIDLLLILIMTLFFILIVAFAIIGLEDNPVNVFLVFIVMLGIIISYFTNITAAMIYSIIFIFLFASVHIFYNFTRGIPIKGEVYFWMLTVPIFAIGFAFFGNLIRNIQKQNEDLLQENAEYVMFDKKTGLMNSRTFFQELQVFMKINQRYNIDLYLMLVKIRYENAVIRILGESKYTKMVNKISLAIKSILREEDKKYILRDLNMFGIILLSREGGGKVVKERLKEKIENIDFKDDAIINKVDLEVQTGVAAYDAELIKNPYEFYKMAERDLEYDV
jgi:GGDEF domain-containing protein